MDKSKLTLRSKELRTGNRLAIRSLKLSDGNMAGIQWMTIIYIFTQ